MCAACNFPIFTHQPYEAGSIRYFFRNAADALQTGNACSACNAFRLDAAQCNEAGTGAFSTMRQAALVKFTEEEMTDLKIRQDVLDELAFEPSVDAANIGVSVEDGIATLSGHVTSYAEKLAAEDVAMRVKGVRAVTVDIEVRYPERKQHADDQIASRALDIITWNTALPEGPIHVKVEGGWVTLSGDVHWQFQKTAAEEAVRKLGGVRGVINLIVVRPGPTVTDVRGRIEAALRRNAEVDAGKISVEVHDRRVVLEGGVRAWNERAAAERAAWSVPGVSAVENHIRIT